MRFRDKLVRFMYGRYGNDQLGRFMLILTGIVCIISLFVPYGRLSSALSTFIMAMLIIIYFRMFSRNIYKRAHENEVFLKKTAFFKNKFRTKKTMWEQKDYYRFFKCPKCRQNIRVPKGRGKIQIRCPKCNEKFIRKS